MSEYSDAASRSGQRNFTGDDRALFLTGFGGMVITAYLAAMDYQQLRHRKTITSGKSELFPIIGRVTEAAEHTPGELILGGKVEHDDKEITVDKMLFSSVFIPEIDEMLNHIEVRGPYAQQIGQALGVLTAKRIAIMHILASRDTDNGPGQPVPSYSFDANMRTSASAIETAAFAAKEYFGVNDMSGNAPELRLPWAQYLLCARNLGLQSTDVSRAEAGSGDRVNATIGRIGGITPSATNHIPKTNITTGLAKYQGDFSTTVGHISSKEAVGTLERKPITITMKEQAERLGTIIIGSKLDGHGKLRSECAYELATTTR